MKWGLSVLDWHRHAIDEWGDHPLGVYKAECGHLLMMVVTLHDRPGGSPCEACALKQLAALPPEEFGATCRRAGPDDPPVDLTLPTQNRRPAPEPLRRCRMTWYRQSTNDRDTQTNDRDTHRGVLARGTVHTECGLAFRVSQAVRLDLAPGQRPPDANRICLTCDRVAEMNSEFVVTGEDPDGRPRTITLWRQVDLVEGTVVRRVVVSLGRHVNTATTLTRAQAVELAEAIVAVAR